MHKGEGGGRKCVLVTRERQEAQVDVVVKPFPQTTHTHVHILAHTTVQPPNLSPPTNKNNQNPDYYEARCEAIYPHNKTVKVVSEISNEFGENEQFYAPYDVLVYAVGATVRAPSSSVGMGVGVGVRVGVWVCVRVCWGKKGSGANGSGEVAIGVRRF
jgi:NADH dehydrogenase FAD-containing subunit